VVEALALASLVLLVAFLAVYLRTSEALENPRSPVDHQYWEAIEREARHFRDYPEDL
jgi:hypothetical protein